MQNSVLFGILMTLLCAPQTAGELAEKYELSERSVLRYLDTLESSGVPLLRKRGKEGGFALDAKHLLDKVYFTKEETDYLTQAAHLCEPPTTSATKQSVLDKLAALASLRRKDDQAVYTTPKLVVSGDGWLDNASTVFAQMHRAVSSNIAVLITYADADSNQTIRKIYPHTLVLKDSTWYVYAFCTVRDDFRLFAFSGIRDISMTEETFAPIPYDESAAPWSSPLPDMHAADHEILCTDAARHVLADRYGAQITANANGEQDQFPYRATFRVRPCESLLRTLLSYACELRIIQPQSLHTELKHRLKRALDSCEPTI